MAVGWDAGKSFSVKIVRILIVDSGVSKNEKFNGINWTPLKRNCFVWRLVKNKIPTYDNLLKKGVTLNSSLCPFL